MIMGYPNHDEIRAVYHRAGDYAARIGMDLYNGKRLYAILTRFRMRNIKLDFIHVDTVNSDRPSEPVIRGAIGGVELGLLLPH